MKISITIRRWLIISAISITVTVSSLSSISAKMPIGSRFKGNLKEFDGRNAKFDSIMIAYKPPLTITRVDYEATTIMTDNHGNFSINLPYFPEPGTMKIFVNHDGHWETVGLIQVFFFESTDRINVRIVKGKTPFTDKLSFSGKGSEKYNLITELDTISNAMGAGLFRINYSKIYADSTMDVFTKVDTYTLLAQKLFKQKTTAIEKSHISSQMKKMVSYNHAFIYSDWLWMMSNLLAENASRPEIYRAILEKIDSNKEMRYQADSLMAYCPYYLGKLSMDEARIMQIQMIPIPVTVEDVFNSIKENYTGKLREMLIANMFVGGEGYLEGMTLNTRIIDSLMNNGFQYINIPQIKKIYEAQLKLAEGKQVFDATFQDVNGKEVKLSSLKGKVVLLDIWFTGCGACARFHQDFHHNSYGSVKNEADFVYLSINLDGNQETWLKTLQGDQYSSKEYLNVYSEMSYNHPFLKYYNIYGAPFLMVIARDGKIYSTKVGNGKNALELINQALALPAQSSSDDNNE